MLMKKNLLNLLHTTVLMLAIAAFPTGFLANEIWRWIIWITGMFLAISGMYYTLRFNTSNTAITKALSSIVACMLIIPTAMVITILGCILFILYLSIDLTLICRKTILKIILPLAISASLIALPVSYILLDNWWIISTIWLVALLILGFGGYYFIPLFIEENKKEKSFYAFLSLLIILFSTGLSISAILFSHFVSFDYGGILLIFWGLLGLIITFVISTVAYIICKIVETFKAI